MAYTATTAFADDVIYNGATFLTEEEIDKINFAEAAELVQYYTYKTKDGLVAVNALLIAP